MSRWGELIPHHDDDTCQCGCRDEPEPCSDGLGRLYPFPHQRPQCGGVCVRCGQTVDPARQPVANGHGEGRCPSIPTSEEQS